MANASLIRLTLAVLAGTAVAAGTASANDTLRNARAKADQLCASYGPGFVAAGDGPGHCVKVEERLRVDPNGRRAMPGFGNPSAFAPIEDGPMRAHVRVNGGFALQPLAPGQ